MLSIYCMRSLTYIFRQKMLSYARHTVADQDRLNADPDQAFQVNPDPDTDLVPDPGF